MDYTNDPYAFLFATTTNGSISNRLFYTGRERDADTLLYYNRARYLDPLLGSFISEDSLGFSAGVNFYTYANNNPVNGNDPSGRVLQVIGTSADKSYLNAQLALARQNSSGSLALTLADQAKYQITLGIGGNVAGQTTGATNREIEIRPDLIAQSITLFKSDDTGLSMALPLQVPETIIHEITHALRPPVAIGTSRSDVLTDEYATINTYENNMYFDQTGFTRQSYESFPNLSPGSVFQASDASAIVNKADQQFQGIGAIKIGSSQLTDDTSAAAAGGYLLYPNQPNNNGVQSAYSKRP